MNKKDYDKGQQDLLNAYRFFAWTILRSEEIDFVKSFFKNSENFTEADEELLLTIMKNSRINSHVFAKFLLSLDPDEVMDLYKALISRRNDKYRDQVKNIIDEIGIDNLYEIINELDGKTNKK